MRRRLLADVSDEEMLAERLRRDPSLHRIGDESELSELAHLLSDLEGEFTTFLDEDLPALMSSEPSPDALHDALLDVADRLREVARVMAHVRLFREYVSLYLVPAEQGMLGDDE